MKINYNDIDSLVLEATCESISIHEWDKYMEGHVRANKKRVDALVKRLLPGLYESLALDFPNPYNYYRTKTHFILVHSSIEYFLKFS